MSNANPIFQQIFDTLRYPKEPHYYSDDKPLNYNYEEHESRHSLGFDRSDPEFMDAHEEMWTEGENEWQD
jgi:hypothetical protein